jgi:Bacteriocin-protection, YdeI or OmpD-Associated/Domain of unknown function (DUF1905)
MVPFDPYEAWGAKAGHPVSGMIGGCRVRTRFEPAGRGWALTLAPKRLIGMGIAIGDEVSVELAPEGPQRGDLADDIAAALAANPAAGAFFDTLAQFYRKAYLRWIDSTTRRPGLRAARIAEVVGLLAAGVKERPRSLGRLPGAIIGDRPDGSPAGGHVLSSRGNELAYREAVRPGARALIFRLPAGAPALL